MPNDTVGYALVSRVYRTIMRSCENCGKRGQWDVCPPPKRPGCHATCVRDPRLLAQHPECQEWQRDYDAWETTHYYQEPNGGTRLGPLHYFSDCKRLAPRNRREDAKVIELDSAMVQALDLPPCKECRAKLAGYEEQMAGVAVAAMK